tara:strand:+ start:60 stop:1904 length:1845 start_codon:yes stop_codon:yes gene_type:complete
MLTLIRDKLKTWAIIFLIVIIAIPLIFLGVGDYGSNQEQYAFKINDQEVNKSIVLQEMRQFKDVLRKNYQGNIPPIYTDEFIKKITIDNLVRRNIENQMSTRLGLVLSDLSVIEDIKNTSSFRDENGFNSKLYKQRLFMINMNPEIYEQFIYQKGIREQLRTSITDTAILSINDKKININAQYHKRNGKLLVLKENDIKKNITINLDEINNYYENNKESFMSNESAVFEYIRLTKKDFIASINISTDELMNEYQKNLGNGQYKLDDLYEINHLVYPVSGNKETVINDAEESIKKIKGNHSFSYIAENYNVSDDTKENKGYIGKLSLSELPDIIKLNIIEMSVNDIRLIKTENNAIHVIKLKDKIIGLNKAFEQVKNQINDKLSNMKGTDEYFMTLDKIKNDLYTDNKLLSDVAKKYDINITSTPKIDRFYKDDVLNSQVLFKLFSDISNNKVLSPIYISNDDVLLVYMKKYYKPKQLDINSSEAAIKALLITQKSREAISKEATLILNNLNKGLNLSYDKFSLHMYDKVYSDEIIEIISNQGITNNFISTKMKSGDYVFVKVDSIIEDIDKKKIEEDNFMDYLENTQSESDYNSLYISKYNNFDIDINTNFLNQ